MNWFKWKEGLYGLSVPYDFFRGKRSGRGQNGTVQLNENSFVVDMSSGPENSNVLILQYKLAPSAATCCTVGGHPPWPEPGVSSCFDFIIWRRSGCNYATEA